jgi:ABC-type dipeptide/oligopeptide/nickel transport system permease component
MTYRSRVDRWLLVAVLASAAGCLAAGVAAMLTSPSGTASLAAIFLLLVSAFPVWILGATYYVLAGEELQVRSGPFRWRIPIREIRAVTPTRNPLSSPALSLDRLRIEYGGSKWIMISPRDREGFLRELERRRAL